MRISELASATHVAPSTLRFYEGKGLLPSPTRTPSGYRDYDKPAIDQVHFIRTLQRAGLTLDDIAALVHIRDTPEPTSPSESALLALATTLVDEQLDTLTRMRTRLAEFAGLSGAALPATRPPC